jgi:hypothetical protein
MQPDVTQRDVLALKFRSDIVTGSGVSQVVFDDPSGNPIELFQPAARPPAS